MLEPMKHTNPFRTMAQKAGNMQKLMEKLHPVSYSTVYEYVRGRTTGISDVMRKALAKYYTEAEIDELDAEYKAWREERSQVTIRTG